MKTIIATRAMLTAYSNRHKKDLCCFKCGKKSASKRKTQPHTTIFALLLFKLYPKSRNVKKGGDERKLSATTGIDWVLGRYDGPYPFSLGGKVLGVPSISKHAENTLQAGTGTRKADLHSTNIYWSLDFRLKMQRLEGYFNTHAMVTAEGTLPVHSLYTYDGITKKGFTNCLVDKASLTIGMTGAIIGDFSVIALGNEDKDLTIEPLTEAPMTKSAVSTLTVGAVSKASNFTSIKISVDNHVLKQASGTGDTIADSFAKEATYTIDIEIIKKGALSYAYDTTKQQDIVLALTDNQDTPVTKTYTFANMAVRENAYSVDELDITKERISAEGNSVVIT